VPEATSIVPHIPALHVATTHSLPVVGQSAGVAQLPPAPPVPLLLLVVMPPVPPVPLLLLVAMPPVPPVAMPPVPLLLLVMPPVPPVPLLLLVMPPEPLELLLLVLVPLELLLLLDVPPVPPVEDMVSAPRQPVPAAKSPTTTDERKQTRALFMVPRSAPGAALPRSDVRAFLSIRTAPGASAT
jgi:hypothetical protein